MVRQAAMNLVLNARDAVKAVAAEQRAIDIAITPAAAKCSSRCGISGPGMPTDLMEQIFHPFVTTKEGHAGLGLATVRAR